MKKFVLGIILGTGIVSLSFFKLTLSDIFYKDSTVTVAEKNSAETPAQHEIIDDNAQPNKYSRPSFPQAQEETPSGENQEAPVEESPQNFKEIQTEYDELHAVPFCNNHKIEEPSGIVYHDAHGSYYVVGDQGELYQVSKTGQLEKKKKLKNGDFEGITVDPVTQLLYIAVEGDEEILEVNPDNFKIVRKFTVERYFQGKLVLDEEDDGIEGLTYNPHTKSFFLTNQQFNNDKSADASAVFELEFPQSNKGNQKLRIIHYKKMPITDLSVISYDVNKSVFYVVSDINDTLITMDRDFNILDQTILPGLDQEGLALTPEGDFLIAQDSGGIVKAIKKKKQSWMDDIWFFAMI